MRLKIAWLHPHFCYWTGGTKYILAVLKDLSNIYDVTIFTEDYNDEIKNDFDKLGIKIVKIAQFSTNRIIYWVIFPIILLKEIFILRRVLPRYYRIVTSMFPMNILGNVISPKNHIQFVFEPFAFFHDKKMINGQPFIIKILMKIASILYGGLDIHFTKVSKVIMTVNKDVSKWIAKVYGKKSIPSYLIVDTKKFSRVRSRLLELEYNNKLVVLHSTDLTPLKRTPFIMSGFREVVKKIPNALLLIISPLDISKNRNRLLEYAKRQGISHNIKILGFVENKDLAAVYSLARCAVYAGVGDGAGSCSYFVLEVMSCQTPVVRTSNSTEEVEDGVSGYLFNSNDKKKLVNSIINLLEDEKLARKMGFEARKRIANYYTNKVVRESFQLAFKSI